MDKTLHFRIIGDCVFLLITIGISFAVRYLLRFQPKGIICGDISIQKKYKPSSISDLYLNIAFCLFPFIFLIVVEFALYPWRGKQEIKEKAIMKTYSIMAVFTFGMFAQSALVTFLQIFTGEPRPHFLDVCKPNFNCSLTEFTYMEQFECTGDASIVKKARQSFPSSVAARSALSMVFLSIYIHSKLNCERTPYGKWLLQTALVMSSILASIQRVSDNMNHWRDVYSGLAIGTCSATFFAYSVNWFKTKKLEV